MAGEERRMLFDIRGRRRNVIRVVYACLALLMGASLFVAVGPFNIGEFFGGGSAKSAAEISEEQAGRVEALLVKEPKNEDLLLRLTRVRLAAGQASSEVDPTTGESIPTEEAIEQYELAGEAWNRYLKQAGDEANAIAASQVASSFALIANSSGTFEGFNPNIEAATRAQKVAAEANPNLNTLSTLAIYQYFNGEFEAGDRTAKKAEAQTTSKSQRKTLESQLASRRKAAKKLDEQRQKAAKVEAKQGKEELENPLGGLSGESGLTP